MKNGKKHINIIDVIFILILVVAVGFGAFKIANIEKATNSTPSTKITYTVEVQNKDPEILDYISKDDNVFEDASMKTMGVVSNVSYTPYKMMAENHNDKSITIQETTDKITLNIKIDATGAVKDGVASVDSVNLLVGKTIDLIAGDCKVQGVIVAIDYDDTDEIKEAQE